MPRLHSARFSGAVVRLLALFLALVVVVQPVCARAFFGEFTIRDEIEAGRKFDKMVRRRMPIVEDPEITDYVEGLVKRIANRMPAQPFPLTVRVVRHSAMNAFAVPGGYVYVFTGLIENLEHESQVAAVLAHELAHVSQRHVAQRMEQMQYVSIASILGALAGVFLGMAGGEATSGLGNAMAVGSMAAGQAAFLTYTQQNENEADHVGMNYLLEAGYRPEAMPETFEIMQRRRWSYASSNLPSYLSTHPGIPERINYLEDRIRRMPPAYVERRDIDEEYDRIRSLVRARYMDTKPALAWYEDHKGQLSCMDILGHGIVLSRLNRPTQAKPFYNQAVECAPEDELILREAGRFAYENGDFDTAAKYLQKAVALDPRDTMALFFLARILAHEEHYDSAIKYMKDVAAKHPEDAEVQFHLGKIMGQSGDHFGGYLHMAYASLYRGEMEKVAMLADKAKRLVKTPVQEEELDALEEAVKKEKERS